MKLGAAIAFLLALRAAPVAAQAMNLSWDDCGAAGVGDKSFACDTNVGWVTAYGSAIAGISLPMLNAAEGVIELQTGQASLSPWWRFASGGCRSIAPSPLTADFSFLGETSCLDPWQGQATGTVLYYEEYDGPGTARIRAVCMLSDPTSINGTDEYYLFKLRIGFENSTGAGSCAGCADPACLGLGVVHLGQPGGGANSYVTISTPGVRHDVTWQGSDGSRCDAVLPARTSTWGAVKSLYR